MNKRNAPIGTINVTYPSNKAKIHKVVETKAVICSGVDESSRHPRVVIAIKDKEGKCPYCGIIFQRNI